MFVYNEAKKLIGSGDIDLTADDLRILLVMTNTTADTEKNADVIDDFTTLDEMNGANYVRKALASEATSEDATNNRFEFDAADVAFTSLGAGTRSVAGVLLYKHVTNDTDSIPIAYWPEGFPYAASGNTLNINFNAQGILQLA